MTTAASLNNHSLVGNALNLLADGLGPYVVSKVEDAMADGRFDPANADALDEIAGDVAATLRVMTAAWNEIFRDYLGPVERSLVSEIREIRNRWAHQKAFDDDDLDRALDSVGRLLAAVGAINEANRVHRAKHRLRLRRYGVPTPKAPADVRPEPAAASEPEPPTQPALASETAPPPQPALASEPAPPPQPAPASEPEPGPPPSAAGEPASPVDAEPIARAADDHISRGVAYRRQEKYEQAMAEFEQAASINPDHADALYHHGLTWGLMGEHSRAVADFTRAISLAPEYADAYNCRGYARLCLGEYRLALRDLEQASQLNPADELTQRNLRQARRHCTQSPQQG